MDFLEKSSASSHWSEICTGLTLSEKIPIVFDGLYMIALDPFYHVLLLLFHWRWDLWALWRYNCSVLNLKLRWLFTDHQRCPKDTISVRFIFLSVIFSNISNNSGWKNCWLEEGSPIPCRNPQRMSCNVYVHMRDTMRGNGTRKYVNLYWSYIEFPT